MPVGVVERTATATASSRLAMEAAGTYPIVKLPLGLWSHPSGGGDEGAMPISTAWAEEVAAKASAVRAATVRMVLSGRDNDAGEGVGWLEMAGVDNEGSKNNVRF